MKDCTYYDLLGVSSSATEEEITAAKNFLVKKFHPDSNIDSSYDTTAYMQNILTAYRILSDPKKRRAYDRHVEAFLTQGSAQKNARARRNGPLSDDFTPYWEASSKLNELLKKSDAILSQAASDMPKALKLVMRKDKDPAPEHDGRLTKLSNEARGYIKTLESGKIPRAYWCPHAMNFLLFQWTQNRSYTYEMLFGLYDGYMTQKKAGIEKRNIQTAAAKFEKSLTALLSYSENV